MDEAHRKLNDLLVDTFNAILKVEEQSLRQATGGGVTVTEMHALDAIGLTQERTVSELAQKSRVTVSTMTISLKRLERKGLVRRVRDARDLRVVRVQLTDKGRAIAEAHQRFHRQMVAAVVQELPASDMSILLQAMENLSRFFLDESSNASYADAFRLPQEPDSGGPLQQAEEKGMTR